MGMMAWLGFRDEELRLTETRWCFMRVYVVSKVVGGGRWRLRVVECREGRFGQLEPKLPRPTRADAWRPTRVG